LTEEPQDFMDLFWKPEVERLMKALRDAGCTNCSEWPDFLKVAEQKLPFKSTFLQLHGAVAEGIGLGSHYPELTERLLSYTANSGNWSRAYTAGLDIPASAPKPKPIRERQMDAASMVRPYIEKARPDLLAKLGL
jgi:hypothetical protein